MIEPPLLRPDWAAPAGVHALVTLRDGGVSRGAWGRDGGLPGGWNLGAHCGDDPAAVAVNRQRLGEWLPAAPQWINQVHGRLVVDVDRIADDPPDFRSDPNTSAGSARSLPVADALITSRRGRVIAVLTADCLPVFVCADDASAIGIAHAGWRGLAAGVIEHMLTALRDKAPGRRWIAWLGPCIGPLRFEVGEDVRQAFVGQDAGAAAAFVATDTNGKWFADLPALARRRLAAGGVRHVGGGGLCTVSDPARFYSYRRDGQTGRMASVAWLD